MTEVLSHFDYGVHPIKASAFENGIVYNTKEKLIYCAVNKYFDYLEAGLPIIAAHPKLMLQEMEKDMPGQIILNWTLEQYDFDEMRRRKAELKNNVLRGRGRLKMDNHIDRLKDFYKQVQYIAETRCDG